MLLGLGSDSLLQVSKQLLKKGHLFSVFSSLHADPNYFWLLLLGQAVSSITNVLEWSAPSLLSAVWFPQNERAFATASVGATAPQVNKFSALQEALLYFVAFRSTTPINNRHFPFLGWYFA